MSVSSNVAECVVESLIAWDCRVVFGVAGDAILPFLDALSAQSHRIEFVALHHAESAALAASAYAKHTGRIGVCTAAAGPGAAQLVNGLADALSDGAPVFAVTGQVPTARIGTHARRYIDQSALLNAVTRESRPLANPKAVAELLVQLLRTAAGERTATHLAVPQDLWSQPAGGGAPPAPYLFTPVQSSGEVWEAAAQLFAAAQRPLIMAGLGARDATFELVALAERAGCGLVHSLGLSGLLPGEHPLNLGGIGEGGSEAARVALREADLVLRIGVNWWPRRFVPADLAAIDVDARPAHVGLGLGQSYGVVADAADFARFLGQRTGGDRPLWRSEVQRLAADWRERLAAERRAPGQGVHPGALVAALARQVPPEAVIALDVGEHVLWFNRHFTGRGQRLLFSGNWRTMGFGLPAAIAASCAEPGRPVLALVGDGGLGMLPSELATAGRRRLPITIVVCNNGALALEAHRAELAGLRPVGTRLANPDFCAMATACGGAAVRAATLDQFDSALREAFAAPAGLRLIDVQTASPILPALEETPREQPAPALASV